jgi:hypothetical protein
MMLHCVDMAFGIFVSYTYSKEIKEEERTSRRKNCSTFLDEDEWN